MTNSLPPDFWDSLVLLGRASARYTLKTGRKVIVVGGAAVSFHTQGAILSGDFDLVADSDFEPELLVEGFIPEHRKGRLLIGYYHPDIQRFGFQLVSGALFDGLSDVTRVLPIFMSEESEVVFPPVEDLVADRLGQYASGTAPKMLEQARVLFELAPDCDETYLRKRVYDEGGDAALIGLF